jgi:valyl-tRNA synthetase
MDELAKPAIEVVERDEVRIVPDQWKRVYLDWMERIRPWCISRQLWWGHRLPVWYGPGEEVFVATSEEGAREQAEAAGIEPSGLRQDEDVLDTWFSSAIWPFATLGWPDDTPELRAFYPTDFLTTAREILFLWVARMIMTGLEFAGAIPFDDVYVHSVIQAPDGRRMSKSLGTGIDPLETIDEHGADALRFGLLAMSSTQDVRYSAAKVQQGQDLANKMWNASRLVLLNAADVEPAARPERIEDRWILSRLQRAVAEISDNLTGYDFAHAAMELYRFFWSELCDWYLEIVKPRLYDKEEAVSATLLHVLERFLALAHPLMPFVTEEINAHVPGVEGMLATRPFPVPDDDLVDEAAEAEIEAAIELTRGLRRWRDLAGVAAGTVLSGRVANGDPPHELVSRLARISLDGGEGEAVASVGSIEVLSSDEIDADQVRERIEERRRKLTSEVKRAEGKLSNEGFVERAPAEVVEAEREKLEGYRAELEELGS